MSSDLVTRLQERFHCCVSDLVADEPFALLDFPDHANVGDSAIWLGEIAYLRKWKQRTPAYVSSLRTHDDQAMAAAIGGGPILIHGGGNFGDVWPHHQDFREKVMQRWRDRTIIQLPQSIHYRSPERLETTRQVIREHGKFVLLVRDQESFDLANAKFDCDVRLCPDAAFALGMLTVPEPLFDILALLRTDDERAAFGTPDLPPDIRVEDWLGESKAGVRTTKGLALATSVIRGRGKFQRQAMFDAAARNRVTRGIRQLARGRTIVTDRLHAHILSLLIGRPHAVLDNNYGKVTRFMSAFSGASPLAFRARSFDEALLWARRAARTTA